MLFDSSAFALFLPLMLLLYWGLKGDARRWALLLGSYFFYGWWDWRFCGLLGLSTVVDYCCALWIEQSADARGRKRILTLSVVTSLGILGTFKYFNFFRDSARTAFGALGIDLPLPVIDVVLPAGFRSTLSRRCRTRSTCTGV